MSEILENSEFQQMIENIIPMQYLDSMMLRDDDSFLSLVEVYLSGFKKDEVVKSILRIRIERIRERLDQVDLLIDDM